MVEIKLIEENFSWQSQISNVFFMCPVFERSQIRLDQKILRLSFAKANFFSPFGQPRYDRVSKLGTPKNGFGRCWWQPAILGGFADALGFFHSMNPEDRSLSSLFRKKHHFGVSILDGFLLAIVLVPGKVCPKCKGLEPQRVQTSDDQRVVIEDGGTWKGSKGMAVYPPLLPLPSDLIRITSTGPRFGSLIQGQPCC